MDERYPVDARVHGEIGEIKEGEGVYIIETKHGECRVEFTFLDCAQVSPCFGLHHFQVSKVYGIVCNNPHPKGYSVVEMTLHRTVASE